MPVSSEGRKGLQIEEMPACPRVCPATHSGFGATPTCGQKTIAARFFRNPSGSGRAAVLVAGSSTTEDGDREIRELDKRVSEPE